VRCAIGSWGGAASEYGRLCQGAGGLGATDGATAPPEGANVVYAHLYGHQFVLMTLGGTNFSINRTPMTYVMAARELLTGNPGEQYSLAVTQLSSILWTLPRLPVASLQKVAEGFMVLKLFTLAVTIIAAFRYVRTAPPIAVLAWTALAAHLPMLFINAPNSFRYAMMGWDLSAILTVIVCADYIRRARSSRLSYGDERPRNISPLVSSRL